MRQTKIVATLGPASSSDAAVAQLVAAGVDVFRLNFSHGNHDTHGEAVRRIRRAADEAGRVVAILQDLSGPKIRTGRLQDGRPLSLEIGDTLHVAVGDFAGGPGRVSTSYEHLPQVVRRGDRLLLDDGHIQLEVEETDGQEIRTTVVDGGSLGEHKGINVPGVALPSAGLTPKDEADLRFGVQAGVDLESFLLPSPVTNGRWPNSGTTEETPSSTSARWSGIWRGVLERRSSPRSTWVISISASSTGFTSV
jgi:pyruvate kinase